MSVYTRKGDMGMTGMLSGRREKKNNGLINVNGHIDELSSQLGMVKVIADEETQRMINDLQKRLIQVMGCISTEFQQTLSLQEDVDKFEKSIDKFESLYPKQTEFILPGSCDVSARLDVARTVTRRVERLLVSLAQDIYFDESIIKYFNRLSDYLYSMARMLEFKLMIIDTLKAEYVGDSNEFPDTMNLEISRVIVVETIKKALEIGCNIVVCIVGKEGQPIIIEKMDDAFPISFNLSRKKAYTAAVLKMSTVELGKLTASGADFEGLEDMIDEEIVTLGGGVPIKNKGKVIGAIGVSGGSVEQDVQLAEYGAKIIGRKDI